MRYSVFTASTPDWTPEETVAQLAAQGWDGVEWRITDQQTAEPPGFWAGNRATFPLTGLEYELLRIAEITRTAGLAMSGLGGYVPASDHANVERMLAATATLGAERVRVTMPALASGDYRELMDATRRDLARVADRAAEYGVTALVELHHGTIAASASAAMRLLDGLDPQHVGVIHDIGNLTIEGFEDPLAAFQLLGPYLAHVHVKNVAWMVTGTRPDGGPRWSAEWVPLREGQADIEAYLVALRRFGYDGWVTVEDFSTVTPLAERTRDNLSYLRELDRRSSGRGA
ncbi:sugar phosphate isomerase/epimerase [Micromonospora sp. R77]|uniref:sugar phosphate isomerase/epimerase family protein n=1 Tax=Micromonospora sp. R77 TaxID=2925836 RepID=UPI001F60FBCE|nr:sugar phosphate isomerase/epimerase family protein [Micromonospora sp. R77]MCI4066254.1 sugar phosphate isomerase/epimerase [Micromonospora sp. R77]